MELEKTPADLVAHDEHVQPARMYHMYKCMLLSVAGGGCNMTWLVTLEHLVSAKRKRTDKQFFNFSSTYSS